MDSVTSVVIGNASSADACTVQGAASMSVLRKALNTQAAGAAQLMASLQQPPLATSGSVGTQPNALA
jgi:hypothetical protein